MIPIWKSRIQIGINISNPNPNANNRYQFGKNLIGGKNKSDQIGSK